MKQLLMEAIRHDYKHKSQKFCLWKQSRQRSQGQFLCSDNGDDLLGGFQTVGVQKTNPVILSCSETHSAHSSIQFGVETKIDRGHSIILHRVSQKMHFLAFHQLAEDCQFPTSDQLVVKNVGNSESAFFGTPCSICDRCKKQLNWGQRIMDCDATEKGIFHNCENAMFMSATLLPEVEAGTG